MVGHAAASERECAASESAVQSGQRELREQAIQLLGARAELAAALASAAEAKPVGGTKRTSESRSKAVANKRAKTAHGVARKTAQAVPK